MLEFFICFLKHRYKHLSESNFLKRENAKKNLLKPKGQG